MIRVPSPAKLNLFLHITGRRDNGYHELQTIFQLIDLYDWMTFEPIADGMIHIEGLNEVALEQNLIYRAAQLLKPHAKEPCGLNIQIEKNIPMGAGLGGGSSNAATTLIVLNQLWQCGLNEQQLADYGVQLGADVPIFIFGRNAWAEGIGEHLSFIDLAQKQFIILKPDCFISTQALFSQKTLTRDSKITTFCAYQLEPFNFGNNFEPLARQLYPEVEEAMQYLDQFGLAKLTGTGACVFIEVTVKWI
jgi:4-diphosphocytidyl-2-C-methyl-D-erythritol kinase